jgi:hypothetical protein
MKKLVPALGLLVLMAGLLADASPAFASGNLYVSATGFNTGGNNCQSQSFPCATISYAESLAISGDTIEVGPGTFNDNIQISGLTGITIDGAGSANTIVSAGGNGACAFTIETSASVTLQNLAIDDAQGGGELSCASGVSIASGSTAVLSNDLISHCGEGISNEGTANLNNDTISNNGYGIVGDGTTTVTQSTVSMNGVIGILNDGSATATLTGDTVSSNGQGVENDGTAILNDDTLSGNSGRFSGGGILNLGPDASNPGGTAILTDDTISGNSAAWEGGGIYNGGSMLLVADTIASNTAPAGGGVYADGVFNNSHGTESLGITATIVGENTQTSGGVCDAANGGTITDDSYNLAADGSCALSTANHSEPNTNPLLGALSGNGGPTQTMEPSYFGNGGTGPAIDKIPSGTTVGIAHLCPSTDQRGIARPQGPECDIGSVEDALPSVIIKCKFVNLIFCKGPIVVGGFGWPTRKGPPVGFYWDSTTSKPFAFAKINSQGNFTVKTVMPSFPNGVHTLFAVESTNEDVAVSLTVSPDLNLKPISATSGRVVNVTLAGFDADQPVTLSWNSPTGPSLATVSTGATGSASVSFKVPAASPGRYTVYAQESDGATALAPFTVSGKTSEPTISEVTFTNSDSNPTITVTGSGFGTSPGGSAVNAGCSASGSDYESNDLFLNDVTGSWTAGQVGDCVGLVLSSYTNTKIVFSFGNYYDSASSLSPILLNPGDSFDIGVDAARLSATVP